HCEQCSRRVVAGALVDSRFTAFRDDVEDDIRTRRFLTAELEATIVVCSRLRDLPGFARACSPKSHGGICEGTAARLDLSLDPNPRPLLREPLRACRRHCAEHNKQTKRYGLDHAHGSPLSPQSEPTQNFRRPRAVGNPPWATGSDRRSCSAA